MKVLIIGNGITGITAARHIRKLSNFQITVISEESTHFFSRTALMYIYMGHMKYEHTKPYEDDFWIKNRITLVKARAENINTSQKTVALNNGEILPYDKLIIATGSTPNKMGWPGQNLKGVQGLYSKQDLELMEENTAGISKAVIVGGGLIGIEMAEMLRSRNIAVDFLIREKNYWSSVLPTEESEMVSRHIKEHHINLITETELQEIIGDENGFVKDIITKEGKNIECQFVGLTVGVFPNVDFLRNTEFSIDKGILINEFFETNVSDVYSAGDCAQFLNPKEKHPAIEQLWYTGKMQGENLAQIICGNKIAYQRGIWFNSAKFLNIEYQTYGLMFKQPVDEDDTFYWEHLNGKIAMRANFNKTDFSLTGLNFMGMRFRQAVAEQWIIDKTPIFEVIKNLDKGFFDPEFYTNHHNAIKNTFTTQYSSLTNS